MADEAIIKGRNIVIAIDGSEHAKFAYKWYLSNARREDDKVYLIHAVEMNDLMAYQQFSSPYSYDPDVLASMLKQEKKRVTEQLQQYAELLTETGVNGTVKSVHTTTPGEGIVKIAKELDADVIITGCRGLGKIRRTLIGSTSDYILHHSDIPVVVCRHE